MQLAKHATRVICDRGYLRHQKQWREKLAQRVHCPVEQVESDVVVPVDVASDKPEFAARTLRPKIHEHWKQFVKPLSAQKAKHAGKSLKLESNIDLSDIAKALAKLKLDRGVKPVSAFTGGETEAHKRLSQFIKHHLSNYSKGHNEPSDDATSTLSPYLHFGQISPVEIALKVQESDAPSTDRDVYLEELIVRRELSMNFANFNPKYDEFENLPVWAKKTLTAHKDDKRPEIYTRHQLETAQTDDPYWNAAQREMLATGFMHNYMRMYWGKQVINWKRSAAEAYADILHLNNKYFLDGRDPVSFANVAWIFGQHDRPWANRPVFGMVRYMNQAGLLRKFDMDAYVKKIERLEKEAS
jgi:deoxyribodipyrimidine photo-lyase